MTGSITWNSKKQGVYDLLKKNQMEAVIVDYWKRIPKDSFRNCIKASPGIGQRKTEKRTLFWKMQQLRWNKEIWKGVCNNMASIRERNGKFNVIYSYTNEKGERKQKWEIYETKAEAKRRKKKTGRFLRMKEMSLLSTTIFFRSLVMQSCQRLIPDSLKDIIRVF